MASPEPRSDDDYPDALITIDPAEQVLSWSRGAERTFGWSAAEARGRALASLILPGGGSRGTWLEAVRRGHSLHEALRVRKDGSTFITDATLLPVHDEQGTLLRVAIAERDVTRQRCLRVAQLLEARYRGLLDAAPDAMLIVDRVGRIVLVNGQTERLFGWTRGELIGEEIELLVPERLQGNHPRWRADYFQAPRPRPMGEGRELAARRKDGSEFPAEISLGPVETEAELLVTAAIRDVSERKRLEQLRAEEREEQHRRVAEASRLKSEFLANMSHELRTPLNAIIGFARLMHTGVVGEVAPEHKEYLGDILTSAGHLLQLINDVLDLSKVEAGRLELFPEPVDMERVVGETIDGVRALAAQKQLRVERQIAPEVRQVVIDPARLKQVLLNFLSNALKFTPEGGRVWVRAAADGADWFRLEVQDTGIGIAPADRERLFVEFQQLDAGAAKRHQGTGLGLALTRRLTRALGGEVGVTSEPGRGSTFFARLPRAGAAL